MTPYAIVLHTGTAIDHQVFARSFPANDPQAGPLGVERSDPRDSALRPRGAAHGRDSESGKSHVLDVSLPRDRERHYLQGLVSLVGAAGIALLFPFIILLVGIPIVILLVGWPVVFVVRGVAELSARTARRDSERSSHGAAAHRAG